LGLGFTTGLIFGATFGLIAGPTFGALTFLPDFGTPPDGWTNFLFTRGCADTRGAAVRRTCGAAARLTGAAWDFFCAAEMSVIKAVSFACAGMHIAASARLERTIFNMMRPFGSAVSQTANDARTSHDPGPITF